MTLVVDFFHFKRLEEEKAASFSKIQVNHIKLRYFVLTDQVNSNHFKIVLGYSINVYLAAVMFGLTLK